MTRHTTPVLRRLLVAGVAAVTGLMVAVAPAHAASAYSGMWLQLMSRNRDCLDVPPGTAGSNGGKVQIYACKNAGAGDELNQRFKLTWRGDRGGWMIQSVYSGFCLDADTGSPGDGTWIQMWQCNYTDQQLWDLVPTSVASTVAAGPVPSWARTPYKLVNRYHSEVVGLSMALDYSTNKGRVQLYHSKDVTNQAWDGFELQCQYAYHEHFNWITDSCDPNL